MGRSTFFSVAIERYHAASSLNRQGRGASSPDWAKQPKLYRQYPGAKRIQLPEPKAKPAISRLSPPDYEDTIVSWPYTPDYRKTLTIESIAELLFHSTAISVRKSDMAGHEWTLRINPSAGNLHPEEIHLLIKDVDGITNGIYHFDVESFALELRLNLNETAEKMITALSRTDARLNILLSVVPARSAWKYGERGLRYSLLDAGHIEASLRIAAAQLGWKSVVGRTHKDDQLITAFGLDQSDELPLALIEIGGELKEVSTKFEKRRLNSLHQPNQITTLHNWPGIIEAINATANAAMEEPLAPDDLDIPFSPSSCLGGEWKDLVLGRRSAVGFDPARGCTRKELEWILANALLQSSHWRPEFAEREWVVSYIFAFRVKGLEPGIYRHSFEAPLELIQRGNFANQVIALANEQSIAGSGAFTIVLAADSHNLTDWIGPKGYRLAHQSAGRVGQSLYLGAESVGLSVRGIGAFFDEELKAVLKLAKDWFPVYCLAVGKNLSGPATSLLSMPVSVSATSSEQVFLVQYNIDTRSIIFAERAMKAIAAGYFEKMFGEPVELLKIIETGDKHLAFELEKLSPGALFGVVSPFDGTVSGRISYWHNGKDGPVNGSMDFNFIGQIMDGRFTHRQIDNIGVDIAAELIHNGQAIIDAAKTLVFKGKRSGKIFRIIYKGYNPIRLEAFVADLISKMGLPQYKIDVTADEYGSFGWLEYIDHYTLEDRNIRMLMDEANLFRFGQYFAWSYVFGSCDFTGENLLIGKIPDLPLIHFDHETAFPVHPLPDFEHYLKNLFEGLRIGKFPETFSCLTLEEVSLKTMIRGIAFVMQHFRQNGKDTRFEESISAIIGELIQKKITNRTLLNSTSIYLADPALSTRLQGVIPYYVTTVDNLAQMNLALRIKSFAKT